MESARGTGDARSHVETILVREFTSIFISTRHQLFTRPESLAIRRIRRPNARQRVIKRDDRDTREGIREGAGKRDRERITYVWEKAGGFGVAQKRLRRPIIISRGDAPF